MVFLALNLVDLPGRASLLTDNQGRSSLFQFDDQVSLDVEWVLAVGKRDFSPVATLCGGVRNDRDQASSNNCLMGAVPAPQFQRRLVCILCDPLMVLSLTI